MIQEEYVPINSRKYRRDYFCNHVSTQLLQQLELLTDAIKFQRQKRNTEAVNLYIRWGVDAARSEPCGAYCKSEFASRLIKAANYDFSIPAVNIAFELFANQCEEMKIENTILKRWWFKRADDLLQRKRKCLDIRNGKGNL